MPNKQDYNPEVFCSISLDGVSPKEFNEYHKRETMVLRALILKVLTASCSTYRHLSFAQFDIQTYCDTIDDVSKEINYVYCVSLHPHGSQDSEYVYIILCVNPATSGQLRLKGISIPSKIMQPKSDWFNIRLNWFLWEG